MKPENWSKLKHREEYRRAILQTLYYCSRRNSLPYEESNIAKMFISDIHHKTIQCCSSWTESPQKPNILLTTLWIAEWKGFIAWFMSMQKYVWHLELPPPFNRGAENKNALLSIIQTWTYLSLHSFRSK